MAASNPKLIRPAKNVVGAVRLPGDKSISHRYALLAAIAAGKSRLENFSTGADCASTLRCLRDLGVAIAHNGTRVEVEGAAGRLSAPKHPLDCGNSGSTMRMTAGLLAAQPFACELFGDASLSRRPMARIVDPLRQMGADIMAGADGRPPLRIASAPQGLRGIHYATPVPSAQVKTSLLFAGLFAEGTTIVEETVRTRDHGELALRAFGAEVERTRTSVSLRGGQPLRALDATIPGDISSAAFFMCAAAIFPGSSLVFDNLLMNPTRAVLLDVLTGLGARVSVINLEDHHGELVGTVKVEHGTFRGAKISGSRAAQLIDELPVLAAVAPYTTQGIEIRDAGELRVKESDRIALIATNLRAMGAQYEEHPDGITVPGGQTLHGADIDSGGDHRIAMAFAIAALRADGPSTIHGAEAASISFPEFWELIEKVVEC